MELLTPRLRLREIAEGDWAAVRAYQSDPRYLAWREWTTRSEQDARDFVADRMREAAGRPRRHFPLALELRDDPGLIGIASIRVTEPEHAQGETGIELAPEHWGRGLAREALAALLGLGFGELGLHRVSTVSLADNVAASRLVEGLGFRVEGRLREHRLMGGRWVDSVLHALLAGEWAAGSSRRADTRAPGRPS